MSVNWESLFLQRSRSIIKTGRFIGAALENNLNPYEVEFCALPSSGLVYQRRLHNRLAFAEERKVPHSSVLPSAESGVVIEDTKSRHRK